MVTITIDDAIEAMHRGQHITNNWYINSAREREAYNKFNAPDGTKFIIHDDRSITAVNKIHLTAEPEIQSQITSGVADWFIPSPYDTLDIIEYVLSECKSDIERERVADELVLFGERDLFNVLRFLAYLVDVAEENSIVLGVGRGSSVSSYVLYLMGVHKIDSIKYGLDVKEFLR